MKKILLIAAIIIGLSFSATVSAQSPPHPGFDPPGSGNTPVGGAAPIENGTFILITLALAYTGRKVYILRKRTAPE